MTQKEARLRFIEVWGLETVRYNRLNVPALRQAWNNFTDSLCKAGLITGKQYDRWGNPFFRVRKGKP